MRVLDNCRHGMTGMSDEMATRRTGASEFHLASASSRLCYDRVLQRFSTVLFVLETLMTGSQLSRKAGCK